MGITTKIGDKGFTSLLFGSCDSKDSLRMESCGALDELCSFLGLAKSLTKDKKAKAAIDNIQKDLFIIGAELATEGAYSHKLRQKINSNDITRLESLIKALEKRYIAKMRYFILPGENTLSAVLDITRTVARKAERRAVALKRSGVIKNTLIIVYLNRLSDLLFLIARSYEKRKR